MILTAGTDGNVTTVSDIGIPGHTAIGHTIHLCSTGLTIIIGQAIHGAHPAGIPIDFITTIPIGATVITVVINPGITPIIMFILVQDVMALPPPATGALQGLLPESFPIPQTGRQMIH